jgi:hypothetical protein
VTEVIEVDGDDHVLVEVIEQPGTAIDITTGGAPGPPGPPGPQGAPGPGAGLKMLPPGTWIMPIDVSTITTATCPGGEIRVARGMWETTIDAVSLDITVVGVDATVTAVVYVSNPDGTPGALVAASTPIEASGAAGNRLLPLAPVVPAGVHYIGILVLGATITYRTAASTIPSTYVINQPAGAGLQNCLYRANQTAPPDPFGTPSMRVGMPFIFVRRPA